jgi:hypothetical protein
MKGMISIVFCKFSSIFKLSQLVSDDREGIREIGCDRHNGTANRQQNVLQIITKLQMFKSRIVNESTSEQASQFVHLLSAHQK